MSILQSTFKSSEMMREKIHQRVSLTKVERFFGENELIVSKTNPLGRITYANDVFLRVAGMSEKQTIGAAHSVIRHPDMPRAVFKLMWDVLGEGREIFAYVKNLANNGDFYWVLAHVTPSWDNKGSLTGYHSNRRVPSRKAVSAIAKLYEKLRSIEQDSSARKTGLENSTAALSSILQERELSYEQFIFSL